MCWESRKIHCFFPQKVPTPHRNSRNNLSIFPAFDRISGQAAIGKNSSSCHIFCHGVDRWCCHELHDTIVATKHPKGYFQLGSCVFLLLAPKLLSRFGSDTFRSRRTTWCLFGKSWGRPWDRGGSMCSTCVPVTFLGGLKGNVEGR